MNAVSPNKSIYPSIR